jgi:hypothetical protein
MVVQNRPTTRPNDIRLVDAWPPAGNPSSLLWVVDMRTGGNVRLLEWGDKLYVPVTEGMHLGIGLYNRTGAHRAYPIFVEAANLFDGGPSEPDDCSTRYMWELRPGATMLAHALVNPDSQAGRPLIIVPAHQGFGVGEATFGTERYRGQIRVYERSEAARTRRTPRPTYPTPGFPYGGGDAEVLRDAGSLESFGASSTRGGTKGISFPEVGTTDQVAIGAGEEAYLGKYDTGVTYRRDAQLLGALQLESEADLAEVLRAAQLTPDWYWSAPSDWYQTWRPSPRPTAPRVPVAPTPHTGFGSNQRY